MNDGNFGELGSTRICRYYRHLHPGEDLDPCIDPATREVWWPATGEAFAICDQHFDDHAQTHNLEILREL